MTELTSELERQAARPEVRAHRAQGRGSRILSWSRPQRDADRSLDEERDIFAVCNKLMATIQSVLFP